MTLTAVAIFPLAVGSRCRGGIGGVCFRRRGGGGGGVLGVGVGEVRLYG